LILFALTPILAPLLLLAVLQMRASRAMPLCFVLTGLAVAFVWEVPALRMAAAVLEGWILAASILWIVFGAIILYNVLRVSGALEAMRVRLAAASPDRRAHVLLIAWLFGAFLESVAGFGTPLAVCAPLLVALGFPPAGAIVLTLLANSAPVTFGAAGTPMVIGMFQGLGGVGSDSLLHEAGFLAASLNVLIASFIPLLMVVFFTRFFTPTRSVLSGLTFWKPALLAGFGFTLSAWLAAVYLGPEFPSLVGSLGGFTGVALAFRLGWVARGETSPSSQSETMPLMRAIAPYAALAFLLAASRLVPEVRGALQATTLRIPDILGTGLSASFPLLYSPGTMFLLVSLLAVWLYRLSARNTHDVVDSSLRKFGPSALTLFFALPMVRLFIHSGENGAGLAAMPLELARVASETAGSAWPLFAPFVGALGAFVSGSATFSNLMFSLLQYDAAVATNTPVGVVLGLQAFGASVGNMMSVLNVVAAAAVVGLSGREGQALRLTIVPTLGLCLLAGLVGLIVAAG
jgi:lactate permease